MLWFLTSLPVRGGELSALVQAPYVTRCLVDHIYWIFLHNDTLMKWDGGENWLSAFTGVPIYRATLIKKSHTDTSGCFLHW